MMLFAGYISQAFVSALERVVTDSYLMRSLEMNCRSVVGINTSQYQEAAMNCLEARKN